MKIAFFTDTYLPQINGVTKTLSRLEKYLNNKGHEVLIFAPEYPGNPDAPSTTTFLSLPFALYPECRLSFPNQIRIQLELKKFNPDVVHLMTEFNMGLAGLYHSRFLDIPTISTYTTNFNQYLDYYNLKALHKPCINFFNWFHNASSLTVTPSKETIKKLKADGIHRVSLFTRGIDSKKFSPIHASEEIRKNYQVGNKLLLLYVGRISPEKDLDVLFESYHNLDRKYPEKFALMVVGDGPMKKEYEKKHGDKILFTGYQSGENLQKIYASSDIFTFPSASETLGNVVLEALSSGLPVVGVNSGGVKDLIRNNCNGYLVEPKNPAAFQERIEFLFTQTSRQRIMAYEARSSVSTRDWHYIFHNLTEEYQSISNHHKTKNKYTNIPA
jgi:glycosyltransferase involved in cell wall biosynthesis